MHGTSVNLSILRITYLLIVVCILLTLVRFAHSRSASLLQLRWRPRLMAMPFWQKMMCFSMRFILYVSLRFILYVSLRLMLYCSVRVMVCVVFSLVSFVIVGIGADQNQEWLSILGELSPLILCNYTTI